MGTDGKPVLVDVHGPFCPDCPPRSTVFYRIPPGNAIYLRTANSSSAVQTGRVVIQPSSGGMVGAFLIFGSTKNGVTVSEASVDAMEQFDALRLYAENNLTVTTGLAVAAAQEGALLDVELFDATGRPSIYRGRLEIAPYGQVSKFLNQIPGLENLPLGFRGVLRLSGQGYFSAVGLRTRTNERGDFLITTTPPAAEEDGFYFGEIVFPHLAVGGGYTTELILFSQTVGQATQGGLQIRDRSGRDFNLYVP